MFIVQVASAFKICIEWASDSQEESVTDSKGGSSSSSASSGSYYKDGIADNEIGQLLFCAYSIVFLICTFR